MIGITDRNQDNNSWSKLCDWNLYQLEQGKDLFLTKSRELTLLQATNWRNSQPKRQALVVVDLVRLQLDIGDYYSSISDATRGRSSPSPVTMSFIIIFFWRQRRKFGHFFWFGSTCSHCVLSTFICNNFNVEVLVCLQFSVGVTRTRGQCRRWWNNCSLLAMPAYPIVEVANGTPVSLHGRSLLQQKC